MIYYTMSVLRYPGGKSRAVSTLIEFVPFDAKIILSPFTGGGSFELELRNRGMTILGNDKFEPLYNFWSCLRENKEMLVSEVRKLHPMTKDKFIEMRNTVCDKTFDLFLRAAYYYAINRSSFSGATLSGGFSAEAAQKRFTISSIDRLSNFSSDNFEVLNMDFKDFIELNDEYDFMYLDPPYYLDKNSKLYGDKGDMHENFDHVGLYNILLRRTKWMMSYNDCEWVRNIYSAHKIIPAKWSYSMNKSKKSSEIIILSDKI